VSRRAAERLRPPGPRQQHANLAHEVPPHDTVTEAVVLGAILGQERGEGAARLLPFLAADLFYDPAHQAIFEAISRVTLRGETPDVVGVARELGEQGQLDDLGGSPTLYALVRAWPGQPLHPQQTARYLDDYRLQRLVLRLQRTPLATTGEESVRLLLSHLRDAQRAIVPLARTSAEIAVDVLREYERGPDAGVMATGVYAWDKMLGGVHRKQLYIIGALTGVGKTAMGMTLVRGLAERGFQGLVHSLEMEDTRLFKREISALARIDNWRVQRGRFEEHELDKVRVAVERASKLPWLVRDADGTWPQHLAAYESLCLQYPKLSVVVVDYIGLIQQHELVDETRAQFLDQVSRGLKQLARSMDVAVIALCQLNREAERASRPVLKDLRESGGIAANADAVILLDVKAMRSRKTPYNPDEIQVLDAWIEKNRDGPTGQMQLQYEPRHQAIWDDSLPAEAPWGDDAAPFPEAEEG
jgi:replicative DNA helicase